MKKESFYVIRGIGMTNYLIRNGCDLIKVEDHKDNSNFKVFLFQDTEKLRELMNKYK